MPVRREKITKRLIDSLPSAPGEELVIWDTDLPGFGYRVRPSGNGTYFVRYQIWEGGKRRDPRVRVAGANAPPEEARKKARELLAQVALGEDPAAAKVAEKAALTVADLCAEYLRAAEAGLVITRFGKPKRASTVEIDRGRITRHIVPTIGDKTAAKLNRADVQIMVDRIGRGDTAGEFKTKSRGLARVEGGPGTASRVAELLGGILSWAELRGLVPGPNPVRGIQKARSQARDRTLTPEELGRLGQALRDLNDTLPAACTALRLIALTGLRREEAIGLRWAEIDFGASCLRLPETKTGKSVRVIGSAARDLLSSLPRYSAEFVFPSRDGQNSAALKKPIASIFDHAGLSDARSHDLRRTFASIADAEGYSDATIGELLGHAKRGVTARHYIVRPDAALIAAADKVSARIALALSTSGAAVVSIRRL
ncbi:tyrosine-type recombinase/integrase [Methylocystis echinoides]|uniref:Integrase n=1 Tax=Methylocystis echinoides TaxID=29468 RepID=A0A9W6GWT0_9HYPH|nr:site-specific integrase [Methylocystis echinoides]GLI94294.1 integrase [Methylocystis echinoides]